MLTGAVDRSARGRGRRGHGGAHPRALAGPAFASRRGARFLAETMVAGPPAPTDVPSYSSVDELIEREPLVVEADTAGRRGREADDGPGRARPRSTVGAGRFGLVTDAVLRARVLVDGRPATTPAHEIMDTTAPRS